VEVLDFIEKHWTLITFFFAEVGVLFVFVKSIHRGTKCSLRNDIVEIYEQCKQKKEITKYQLETVYLSFKEYKKLKGNSFVEKLVKEIEEFKITD
jgi:6-phosphogluconate dehydrogenase